LSTIEKWADRVYAEADFGRSIATSLSGLLGLVVYLKTGDWVIAAFGAIIFFPIARLTATAIHGYAASGTERRTKQKKARQLYNSLSADEQSVVSVFVNAGACVVTWKEMNKSSASGFAIESLLQRDVLSVSMTADGMRETFVLDTSMFDEAARHAKRIAASV
jgi:hypothetical protein